MPRPQNSPRGLFAKQRVSVPVSKGVMFEDYSTSADLLTANSTGLISAAGVKVSNKAGGQLTADSTSLTVVGSVIVSNQSTYGLLGANSTATILPNSVRVGSKTTYLSSDSTGIKIGSRYISSNTTGNTTT